MTPTKHCSHILDQSTELEVSIFLTPNGGKEVVIQDCTGGPPRIHESSIPELLQWLARQFPQARAAAGGTESERFNALLDDYRGVLETLEEMQATAAAPNYAVRAARADEARRWASRVCGLTAQLREVDARYMALLKSVADGVAMQPRTVVLELGPNPVPFPHPDANPPA